MANYYCTSRTNYFRVKDRAAFDEWAEKYSMVVIEDKDGRVGLLPGNYTDDGSFPGYDPDTEEDFEIQDEIAGQFLADGSVCIVVQAGAEKLRYVHGHAVAVNNKGDVAVVNLSDIYKLAEKLGEVTRAEY